MAMIFADNEEAKKFYDSLCTKLNDHKVYVTTLRPLQATTDPSKVFALQDHVIGLKDFEDHCTFPSPNKLSCSDLIRKYQLKFNDEDVKVLNAGGSPDAYNFDKTVLEMAIAPEKLPKVRCLHRLQQLQSWVDVPTQQQWISKCVMELYDLLHTDALMFAANDVAGKDDELMKLHQSFARLSADRQRMDNEKKIVETEEYHRQIVVVLQQILHLRKERLSQWIQSHHDVKEHMNVVNTSYASAKEYVSGFETLVSTAKGKVAFDVKTLEDVQHNEERVNHEAIEAFSKVKREMWENIRSNGQEHQRIWHDIVRLFDDLASASTRRQQLITTLMVKTAEEKVRSTTYEVFSEVLAKHLEELRQAQEHLEAQSNVCASMNKYADDVLKNIETKGFTEIAKDNSVKESREYLADLRHFITECGDLATRKEQLLDSVNRQIRSLKHSLELARESLDPNVEHYEKTLQDLFQRKSDVVKAVLALHADLDRETRDFTPVEDILREANVTFSHPVLEHQDFEVERRNVMVKQMAQHLETEQSEVENTMTALRKIATNAAVEREHSKNRSHGSMMKDDHVFTDDEEEDMA